MVLLKDYVSYVLFLLCLLFGGLLLQQLIDGFMQGFVIPTNPVSHDLVVTNHQSVFANPDIVAHKVEVEVELGRVAGPFSSPPSHPFYVSPIGLLLKRTPGEFRLTINFNQ